MSKNLPYELIAKMLSGECTKSEEDELDTWLAKNKDQQKEFELMKTILENTKTEHYKPDVDSALKKVRQQLPKQKSGRHQLVGNLLKLAAVFILGLGIGYFAFIKPASHKQITIVNNQPESLPIEVVLPDGSMIWLRSGSKIEYPKRFSKKGRHVAFEGHAYFDIVPDASKPFEIDAGIAMTKVLGTEFLLEATQNDSVVKVSVTEGKVELSQKDNAKNKIVVTKGTSGIYSKANQSLTQEYIDTINVTSLKTYKLDFYNTPLNIIIEELTKQYNKSFVLHSDIQDTIRYSFSCDSLNLNELLQNLEFLFNVTIENKNDVFEIRQKS